MIATGTRGLLVWCKQITRNYGDDVEVKNMTTSFKNGIAFCAIIHHYRPDLIDFAKLSKENVAENNELAFRIAEQELDIPALLDVEDMVTMRVPDKLSIMTYVSQYYNYFKDKVPGEIEVKKYPTKKRQSTEKILSPPAKKSNESLKSKSSSEGILKPRGSNCCLCGKQVFLMERLTVESKLFHRICFKCCVCDAQLKTSTYEYDSVQGMFYCSRDYKERGKVRQEPIGKAASPTTKKPLQTTNGDTPMTDDSPFKRNQEFARRGIPPQSSPADITWEKPHVIKSKAEDPITVVPAIKKSPGKSKTFFSNLVKKKQSKETISKRNSSDYSNPAYQQHLELSKYMNELDNETQNQRVVVGSESKEPFTENTSPLSGVRVGATSPIRKFAGTVETDMSSSSELSVKSKKKKFVLKTKKKKSKDKDTIDGVTEDDIGAIEEVPPPTEKLKSADYENLDSTTGGPKSGNKNNSVVSNVTNLSRVDQGQHDDQRRSSSVGARDNGRKPRAVSLTINKDVTELPDANYQAVRSNLKKVDCIDVKNDTNKKLTEKSLENNSENVGETYLNIRSRLKTLDSSEKAVVINRSLSNEEDRYSSARKTSTATGSTGIDDNGETETITTDDGRTEQKSRFLSQMSDITKPENSIDTDQNPSHGHNGNTSEVPNSKAFDEQLSNDNAFDTESAIEKDQVQEENIVSEDGISIEEQEIIDDEPKHHIGNTDIEEPGNDDLEIETRKTDSEIDIENSSKEIETTNQDIINGGDNSDQRIIDGGDSTYNNDNTTEVADIDEKENETGISLPVIGTGVSNEIPVESDHEMEVDVEIRKQPDKVEVVLPIGINENRIETSRYEITPSEKEEGFGTGTNTSQISGVDVTMDTTEDVKNGEEVASVLEKKPEESKIKIKELKNENLNPFDDSSDEEELPEPRMIDRSNPFLSSTEDLLDDDENDDTFEESNPFAEDARLERQNTAKTGSLSSPFQRNAVTRLSQRDRDHLQNIGVEESNPFAEDLLDESDEDNVASPVLNQKQQGKKKLVLKKKKRKAPGLPPVSPPVSTSPSQPTASVPTPPVRIGKKRVAPKPPQQSQILPLPTTGVDDMAEDASAPPKPPRRVSSRTLEVDSKSSYANITFEKKEDQEVLENDQDTAANEQPNTSDKSNLNSRSGHKDQEIGSESIVKSEEQNSSSESNVNNDGCEEKHTESEGQFITESEKNTDETTGDHVSTGEATVDADDESKSEHGELDVEIVDGNVARDRNAGSEETEKNDGKDETEGTDSTSELPQLNGTLIESSGKLLRSEAPHQPEKRKAPSRPKPPTKKSVSLNDAQVSENIALRDKQPKREEIEQELRELEMKQRELETEGVTMEKKLRQCSDGEPEDAYLLTWFELVNQKNQLLRRENELIYMGQELDFLQNQRHAEFELRQLMMKTDNEKTEEERDREEELLAHILELVTMRSNIVDKMDEERLREYEEDEEVRSMMESQGLKSPDKTEKSAPAKKHKKKEKKKEKKEKEKKDQKNK